MGRRITEVKYDTGEVMTNGDKKEEGIKEIVSRFKDNEEAANIIPTPAGRPKAVPQKGGEGVLDTYSFLSENIPVEVTIEMKKDFVPFYDISIPGIAGGTKLL
ncbi:hypothetical protein H0O01_02235, partial [Candidatus Micrarchaeota archaeon]|nr:hypothetical protein [Candidatus Micrarchaeota archaeon]